MMDEERVMFALLDLGGITVLHLQTIVSFMKSPDN